ncbi:MAG: bifunctional UDP-3-O-[3-hydroxymyristoyl] N-acetylglucosamine deacetylase/3-hydroxyacyl-ACP dehydratase [Flavobacteriales bacterium]|nr:bifunctional UDP-3-O-[3-hydroxymyristoyl] N-acetylglucosamine deacetylase/3-hydroxyacyl-ACP dehydratase [Flavobacteriales bacterium]
MSEFQKTLKSEINLNGIGLHTGKQVNLTLKPAEENTGFVFVRKDLEGNPTIEADVNFVTTTERGTTLEKKGVKIHTCEHILAALTGMDLDNAIIELDNAEPPILDGSSKYFVEAIEKAGIQQQEAERECFAIKDIITYTDPETGAEITAIPHDKYEVTTLVDFGTKVLGTQNATLKDLNNFKDEIASSRTFSFLHELEMLLDAGLIKGGDLSNAIVYVDKEINEETTQKLKQAFNKDDISVQPNGILNNLELEHPNEAARHKLLDVIGDLTLIGVRLRAKIIATKPGHHVNTQFAKKINRLYKLHKRKNVPEFDLKAEPIYDINGVMNLLPHRPPFLMIDKIIELSDKHVVGVKNVSMNEPYFVGHFPQEPVMPGVLQIEAMAQVGGILVLSQQDNPENFSTYFMKIDKVKFKKKVVPGDTIVFKVELIEPIRRGIVHMQGYAYVNDTIVSEGTMMAQVARNKE